METAPEQALPGRCMAKMETVKLPTGGSISARNAELSFFPSSFARLTPHGGTTGMRTGSAGGKAPIVPASVIREQYLERDTK